MNATLTELIDLRIALSIAHEHAEPNLKESIAKWIDKVEQETADKRFEESLLPFHITNNKFYNLIKQ